MDGGLRAGAASLFAANLATWTTMRAAAGREARGAERRRADAERVAAAAEAEKRTREEAAAAEYEKAELAKAELEDEERRRAKALVAASDAASVASRVPDSVASPAPAVASITALATVNQVTRVAAEAEEPSVGGFAGEEDAAASDAAFADATSSSPATGMPFAVIPSDAEDPRVVAALQDAAEAQVAAANAMRAAAAATRAAADATAAAQLLQTAIAAGADAGEDAPASRAAAAADAKQNAADAERAAAAAEFAAARHVARGERTGFLPPRRCRSCRCRRLPRNRRRRARRAPSEERRARARAPPPRAPLDAARPRWWTACVPSRTNTDLKRRGTRDRSRVSSPPRRGTRGEASTSRRWRETEEPS